jgi:hypothetical protein
MERTIGDELGRFRMPLAWALLGLAAVLLVLPAGVLFAPESEPGVDTFSLRALGAVSHLTGFPLLVLPLLAVVVARGSEALRRAGTVAALEYGVVLVAGLVAVVAVAVGGATYGVFDGTAFGFPLFVLTELVELVLVAVALLVTLRLSRGARAEGAA